MIELRYSVSDELDIPGTVPELQDVRLAVLEVAKSGACIEIDADSSIDPNPYDAALSKLIIATDVRPGNVSVDDSVVHITAAPNCLEALASFLDFKPNAQKGHHTHYEYYEGNKWIASDSVPVVFSVK